MIVVDHRRCCLVGLGGHARNKLVPALEECGWSIEAVVSSSVSELGGAKVFRSLGTSLAALPADMLYVLASPPSVHFEQLRAILERGRDVMVEKPALLRPSDVDVVGQIATRNSLMLVEMFMYLETEVASRAINLLVRERSRIRRMIVDFSLPSLPSGSFRTSVGLANSLLADVGCYPLSLLARAGLSLDGLGAKELPAPRSDIPAYSIYGESAGMEVDARVGGAGGYSNLLRLEFNDGSSWSVEPFFFGRPGNRTIRLENGDSEGGSGRTFVIEEGNAFVRMFAHPRSYWMGTQGTRLTEMRAVASTLARLGESVGL